MAVVEQTLTDFLDGVTGLEDHWVRDAKAFGKPISVLAREDPMELTRALVFIDMRRRKTDADPYQASLKMTIGALKAYFVEAEPEGDAVGEAD